MNSLTEELEKLRSEKELKEQLEHVDEKTITIVQNQMTTDDRSVDSGVELAENIHNVCVEQETKEDPVNEEKSSMETSQVFERLCIPCVESLSGNSVVADSLNIVHMIMSLGNKFLDILYHTA